MSRAFVGSVRTPLMVLLLSSCGGRSHDSRSPVIGSAGSSSLAGTGGAAAVAGAPGTGGAPEAAGAGGTNLDGQLFCWGWSDIKNQPKPGETGPAACPKFYDLEFVVKETCGYTVSQEQAVPPDAASPQDDCCYSVSSFYCR